MAELWTCAGGCGREVVAPDDLEFVYWQPVKGPDAYLAFCDVCYFGSDVAALTRKLVESGRTALTDDEKAELTARCYVGIVNGGRGN